VKCGETEAALRILEHSLEIPAGITLPELQMDPAWDALRGNVRFQRMLTQRGAKKDK
jgi:hypothetical protein